MLFGAFWCFFVLVKSYRKKNKKFKTDLIILFILLLLLLLLLHQISWNFFNARKKESITKSLGEWKKESITSTEDQKFISKFIIK